MSNVIDFAEGLIRSPWIKKIQDRTFQASIAACLAAVGAAYAAWQTPGIPVTDKVNLTMVALGAFSVVVAAFTASEKSKDSKVAVAAIQAQGNLESAIAYDAPAGLAKKLEEVNAAVSKADSYIQDGEAILNFSPKLQEIKWGQLIDNTDEEVIDNENAG